MAQDNITNLYNALKDDYDLGSENDFRKSLENADNRHNLYDAIQNDYDLGSEDDFNNSLGYGNKQQPAESAPANNSSKQASFTQQEYGNLSTVAQDVAKGVGVAPKFDTQGTAQKIKEQLGGTKEKIQFVPEASNVVMATPTADALKKYPFLKADEAVPFNRETGEPFYTWVDENGKPLSQRDIDIRTAKQEITGEREYMQKAPAAPELPDVNANAVKLDGSITDFVDNQMRAKYGDNYLNELFKTSDGREVSGTDYLTELSQGLYDSLVNDVNDARIQYIDADDEQKNQIVTALADKYKGLVSSDTIESNMTDEQLQAEAKDARRRKERQQLDEAYNNAYSQRAAVMGENMAKAQEDYNNASWLDKLFGGSPVQRAYWMNQNDNRIKIADTQINLVLDAKRVLDTGKAYDDGESWSGRFVRGMRDAMKDTGLYDGGIEEMNDLRNVKFALDAYESGNATNEQKDLLDTYALLQTITGENSDALGRMYSAGQTTVQAIPFMLQMYINPIGSLGQSTAKAATQFALKQFGRSMMSKYMKRLLATSFKAGGRITGDMLAASLPAMTFGAPAIGADMYDRLIGNVKGVTDNEGNIEYSSREGQEKSKATAIAKAIGSNYFEYQSEMVGEYFRPLTNILSAGIGKATEKIGLGQINDLIANLSNKNFYRSFSDFAKRTQWQGTIGEYLEEVVNNAENALFIGDMDFSTGPNGVFNKDVNIDTFLGVAAMTGFMSSLKTADYIRTRGRIKNNLDNAYNNGLSLFGVDEWQKISDELDNIDEDNAARTVKRLVNSVDDNDMKQAIANYAAASAMNHGFNIGDLKNNIEEASDNIVNGKVPRSAILGFDSLSPDEQQNVHDDGMIHSAILYPIAENGGNAEQVFIVKGNVALNNDGSVDIKNSSDAIYYKGSDGQIHQVAPDKIQAADVPVSVEDYIAMKSETEETASPENEEVQTNTYSLGEVVNINVNGNNYEATVNSLDGNGNIMVYYQDENGIDRPATFTTEQLDAFNAPQSIEQPVEAQQPAQAVEPVQPVVENNTEQVQPANADGTTQVEQEQPTQQIIPTDKEGNPLYYNAPIEATINDLYDGSLNDEEIQDFIDANIQNAQKKYDSIQKKAPKIGTNKAKYLEQKREWQTNVDEAKRILDYWQSVDNYRKEQTHTTDADIQSAQAELSGDNARAEFDEYNDNGGVNNAVSVASDFIRGAKITPDSFKAETGYGTSEQQKFVGMIAKEENGGKTIDRLAEELVSYDNAELNGVTYRGDTSLAKDAILEALQAAGTRGELAQNNTAEREKYVEARMADLDAQYMEAYGMTYDEYLSYEEQIMPTIWRDYNNYDEVAFNNMYAEEIQQLLNTRENGNTTGEKQTDGRGNQVLPEQQSIEQTGSAGSTKPGTEVQAGVQGTDENAVASEKAQERIIQPVGKNRFGNIYNWAKGQFQSAASFLNNLKSGYLRSVFYRDGIGDIDMVWGNEKAGLQHIIKKHIEEADDFSSVEEAMQIINETISNGDITRQGSNISLDNNGYRVSIAQSDEGKWVLTAFDKTRSRAEKKRNKGNATIGDQSVSDMENGTLASPQLVSSESKDSESLPNEQTVDEKIAEEEKKVDANPTEGQKEVGNYKKGHVRIDGYDITIEQPKGSVRRGTDANGKQWEQMMNNTYGYIRGTEGVDGDHIDIFLSDNPTEGNVYVVDQVNSDGSFDEHKVMYGFNSADEARNAYLSNYEEGWQGLGTITEVSKEEFKKWVESSHRKTKPFAEYKSVNAIGAQNEESADKAMPIQGLQGYSRDEIKNIVKDYIEQKMSDYDIDAEIKGIEIHGSRNRGDARDDSDLDVVFEYEGDIREDDMFNTLNDDTDDEALHIEGIRVDINPIREQETGTLDRYMESSRKYDEEKRNRKNLDSISTRENKDTVIEKEVSPEILSFRQKKIDELNAVKDEDVKKGPSGWYFDKPLLVSAKTKKSAISKMHRRREDDIQSINNGSIDWMYNALQDKGVAGYKEETNAGEEKSATENGFEYGSQNKIVSKERYEELKKRMIKKLGQLNFGMDPELLEIGIEMTAYHLEAGARKFADYAKAMVNDIGDAIRPYLKSLYNAARDYPDVVQAGLNVGMSTSEEVSKFDVTNFDKDIINPIETAQTVAKEQNIKKETEKIIKENEQKDEQTAANTETIASKAETIASEAERNIKAATNERQVIAELEKIDKQLDKVNEQLALLGYYEADRVEKDYNEAYGYIRNAERKAKNDAKSLWQKLAKDLNIPKEILSIVASKGSKNKAVSSNIAPAGGDVTITVPLDEKKNLHIYVGLSPTSAKGEVKPLMEQGKGGAFEGDNLQVDRIMYRIQNNDNTGADKYGGNFFEKPDVTYNQLLNDVLKLVKRYTDVDITPKENVQTEEKAVEEPKKARKKSVSSQKIADLFGDINAKQKSDVQRKFSETVKADMLSALDSGEKPYRSIIDLRKRASDSGMEVDNEGRSDILLQELVEDGLVGAAREVINKYGSESKESYDLICKLYDMQPTIAARSSNRIKMQQYSTPLPMAWNAAHFALNGKQGGKVLEPTAGNGMLVFAVPANQVHVNELDDTRLNNLREQGFAEVTQQDATEPFEGGKQYDAIIANPPFGSRKAVDYDGKMIPGLDPQITLNALSSMKDDGKAAIIIGGNMEYAKNGSIKSMKPFFTYLYDHYNVKGVVDMDGKLYAKQGTTFPTRMILIDGRRSEEERAQTTVYPPVESKAVAKVNSFEELYNTINGIINSKEKTNGTEILHSREREPLSVNSRPSGDTEGNGRTEQPRKDDTTGRGNKSEGSKEQGERVLSGERGTSAGAGETRNEVAGSEQSGSRRSNEPAVQRVGTERVPDNRVGLKEEPKKRTLTEEKLPYRPHNTSFSLNSVAPSAMVEAMDKILTQIEVENGNIDEFVRKELGYDTIEEAHQALAAEQMDSVAMAIYQMKKGQALIIGDQTGVGKGRQMAALIRWAVKRGEKPIFITQKADLFSDIYRDLVDVGSGDLVPFIFNSDGAMVDSNGNVVHKPLSASAMSKVFATGELPDNYDFAVLTYSQVNTGDAISQKEAEEAAKKGGTRAKKSKASKEGKPTPKATFLRSIAKDNYLFLDESHTAAGSSNTGAYLQSILKSAKAATFASATFAKRPDTMPLYAIRTAMSQAKIEPDKLISIIEKGGVTLQEIMSRELTNAGQMVRRERDMSDVKTDWKTINDPETVKRARENYDKTIKAFNAIIKFQNDFVKPKIDDLDQGLAIVAQSAGVKKGTDKMGVENVPFASKTYNYTKQLMLALKVDAIADEVEKEINAGRHPVIALESTMESTIKDYSAGEVIKEPTFSASLLKGLDSVMQYTITDENGKETHARYAPSDLGKAGEEEYYNLQKLIRESTSDIFISPLDAIIERLHEKGYKVGELTGRNLYVERNENGDVVVKRRTDKDKKKMQRDFNSGNLDVLILNKSASTGISLHASEKFKDQRQRTMIIAQPLSDINDYMQMIGRIDRTGQVHRGYYINLGLPVPAENRFLMMLSTKLKSLNANTTTSQDSKSNEVEAPDLLNKYGSQVVVEYLRDNPEVYEKMGTPLKKGGLGSGKVQANELDEYKAQDDDARKVTGYVALLSTKEQEDFYNDVVKRYNDLIQYLNDTGSNDLKINVMPLRAKTLEKRVSSEGIDPNGTNPFAQNAYVEKVEMDVLRKPMKVEEVRKTIDKLNKTNIDATIDVIRKESDAKITSEDTRYENAKQKALDDIQKQKNKIEKSKKLSDEEKVDAINSYITDTNNTIEERHDKNLNKITDNRDQLIRRLRMFDAGKSYLVPDNLESMTFDFASPAIFCGYKVKESKITASTTLAVFATLDSRRRIEIKLSDINALRSIDKMTMDNIDAARAITLDNWDSQIPTETRKEGYILTGNILQAIADSQDEHGSYTGHLVSYTDIDGNVHDGILMPDKWNTSLLKSSGAPLSARMEQIKNYEPIVSLDGKVSLTGSQWAEMYYLTVPKTKKDGAVYYENKVLLDASMGEFYPYRGNLRADIPAKNIENVVNELTKLGVKVRESNDIVSDGSNINEEEANDLFRVVDDESEIERLNSEPTIKVYRAMSLVDGKLYPPMSKKIGTGSNRISQTPSEFGQWEVSDERPQLVEKEGTHKNHIYIVKDNGKGLWVAYNPYFHTSRNPLNDQFAEAYQRPNLVTVEVEVPESELTSGYQADGAKDSVGETKWNAGPVNRQLSGDKKRKVILSRWMRPVRIVPDSEVAERIAELIEGENVAIPDNTVTPSLLSELKKLGVKIVDGINKSRKKSPVVQRSGVGPLTDSELSNANDPAGKMLGKASRTPAQQKAFAERERQRMKQSAENLANKLNLNNVEIVMDANTLKGRRSKAKGFYNRNTNKITIVIPNHSNIFDVEQTLLHEAVAHYGLRELFGEHFDTFLDNVYKNADEKVKEGIDALVDKYNGNVRTATEEYLAKLAEDTNFKDINASWWNKIKDLFLKMLHSIGFENFSGVTLSDNELRYILWRSYENLAEPGRYRSIVGEVKDIAKQHELNVGNYAVRETRESVAENGVDDIEDVNRKFNERLAGLTEGNAQNVILNLGRPGNLLLAAGISDKPIKLYGNKLLKKMRKHGFTTSDVKNLPKEINNPIAVFKGSVENSFAILTELEINGNNVLASLSVGKGNDIDFNIISSVYGKDGNSVVSWINDGKILYVNKEKALNYLRISAPIAEAQDNQKLSSAANIVKNFENPNISEENLLYRESNDAEESLNKSWQDEYDKRTLSTAFKFTEAAQDGMKSVSILQDVISKETGSPITEDENVWALRNRLSSTNKFYQDYYYQNYYKPLMQSVADLVKQGAKYDDLGRDIDKAEDDILKYIISKHGLERNEHFREQKAKEARQSYEQKIDEVLEQVDKGEIKQEEADDQIKKLTKQADKAESRAREKYSKTDFSGLSELYKTGTYFEAFAENYVQGFESKFDTSDLWNKINAVTKATLKLTYESGLMSRAAYETTRDMYQNYIPLRGWSNDVASDMYNYKGETGVGGRIVKRAKGRKSLAENPLAVIGRMGQDGILQANKNRVKQRLYNLAVGHDTSLLTVSKQWYVNEGTDENPEWERAYPELDANMNADEVADVLEEFDERMKELKEEGRATQKREGLNMKYHTSKPQEQQHRVNVSIGGREYNIYVNGNPRAAQAINGELRMDEDSKSIVQAINRFLANVYTSLNPEFIVTNYERDAGFAGAIVAATEDSRYVASWTKNMAIFNPLTSGVYINNLINKATKGTVDLSNKNERYMQEFLANGGETGFTNMLTADDYKKIIKKEIKEINKPIKARQATKAFMEWAKRANRVCEDATRFATYVTSREQGRSIDRAIRDAKEISLNFNTRGADGMANDGIIHKLFRNLRRWIIFTNPSIQGLNKAGVAFKNHPVRSTIVIAGLPTVLGYMVPALAAAILGDDDDKEAKENYMDLPKWVRRTNICLPMGGTKFITIPLSYELRVSYGLGEMLWEIEQGQAESGELVGETLTQLSDLLPISFASGTPVQNLSPTMVRPIIDLIQNKDFTGRPIYKENTYNQGMPEFTKVYAGTSKWLVKSTEVLNNAIPQFWNKDYAKPDKYTPGAININPAKVEYLLSSYFGGLYTFPTKVYKTASMLWDEDMRDIRNIPFINRNLKDSQSGNPVSKSAGDRYNTYMKEYNLSKQRWNGYKREVSHGVTEFLPSLTDFTKSAPCQRMFIIDSYKKSTDELNRQIKYMKEYGYETEQDRKDLQQLSDNLKKELVDKLDSIKSIDE